MVGSALLYALENVSCSVSLVLVNKLVFAAGFTFPMTLTCLHFGFTVVFYRLLAAFRLYEPATAQNFSSSEAFKMAAAGVGSIGFMNISLIFAFYPLPTPPSQSSPRSSLSLLPLPPQTLFMIGSTCA
mmetsp:Transcript_29595/g.62219  ORF Transcript_29595/g.62219 Transcript_29595/m.62219 type:complete len:128 (-) Transcript_29595:1186-1569(-)